MNDGSDREWPVTGVPYSDALWLMTHYSHFIEHQDQLRVGGKAVRWFTKWITVPAGWQLRTCRHQQSECECAMRRQLVVRHGDSDAIAESQCTARWRRRRWLQQASLPQRRPAADLQTETTTYETGRDVRPRQHSRVSTRPPSSWTTLRCRAAGRTVGHDYVTSVCLR